MSLKSIIRYHEMGEKDSFAKVKNPYDNRMGKRRRLLDEHQFPRHRQRPASLPDTATVLDTGSLFTDTSTKAGPLGSLVGLLLDFLASILLTILIAFLLSLGFNLVEAAITALFLPIFFHFMRSLCFIVARGWYCRGISRNPLSTHCDTRSWDQSGFI